METLRVIFLDVDGVVCTRRSFLSNDREGSVWNTWDEVGCQAIRRACSKGIKLVVSSTWRKFENDLWPKMEQHGLKDFVYFPDWKTKVLGPRGAEIGEWLSRHPEVTDFKILDDDSDMLDSQRTHFIKTDALEGMTSDNIKKLLNWSGALKA